MNLEEKEVSINLIDLLAYIIRKWKTALVLLIIVSAVIAGVMSVKDLLANRNIEEPAAEEVIEKEARDNAVTQFYNRYKAYKDRIADNLFYLENSMAMKLNPHMVSVYTVEYLVKTDYQGIMNSLSSSALDLDDYAKMAEVIGEDADPRFVNELIELNGTIQQDSYETDKRETVDSEYEDDKEDAKQYLYTGVLRLSVRSNSRETSEKLAEVVYESVTDQLFKLHAAGIEAEVSQLNDSYTEKVDSELTEYQRAQSDNNMNLQNEFYQFVGTAETTLTEQELEAFKGMLSEEEAASFESILRQSLIQTVADTDDKTEKKEEKVEPVNSRSSWKKRIVLSLAAGLLFAVVVLGLKYMFIPEIRTSDDARLITKENEIGTIIQSPRTGIFLGKVFSALAGRIEFHGIRRLPDEESILLICNRIKEICQSKKSEKVLILSDSESDYAKEVVEKCVKNLSEFGIEARKGNPSSSVTDLKAVSESEGMVAVLALTIKGSLPESVRSNMAVCGENEIPIVGNFLIHPQV